MEKFDRKYWIYDGGHFTMNDIFYLKRNQNEPNCTPVQHYIWCSFVYIDLDFSVMSTQSKQSTVCDRNRLITRIMLDSRKHCFGFLVRDV